MAGDEQHAKMLAEIAQSQGKNDARPPMRSWSTEVDLLTQIHDGIRITNYLLQAVNSEKGKGPKPPQPSPRPYTALEKARRDLRQEKHERLADRLLPHRKKSTGGPA